MMISALRKRMTEQDKILHIRYSAGIMLASYVFLPVMYAIMFTFLVGLLKECWDHYYGSGFCLYDMLANMIGILSSLFVLKTAVLILDTFT